MIMMCPSYNEEPERYSSYKKRKFEAYRVKLQRILTGINELSLKETDKVKLKGRLLEQLSTNLL